MLARFLKHGQQRRRDLQPTRDMPEIEGHCGPDQARQVGRLKTVLEGPNPLRLRHAPEGVLSDHTRNVGPEPCADQTRVHILGDPLEIGVNLRVGGIGIGKRIVLIRGEGELAAGHAPEREPSPSAGRGSVTRDGEIEQAHRVTASQLSASTRPMSGALKSGLNQSYEQPRQLFGSGVKSRFAGRVEDGGAKGKRAPIGQSHQVARGHEAHDLASRVRNRQVLARPHKACRVRHPPHSDPRGQSEEGGS